MRVVGLPRPFYQLAKTTRGDLTPEAQERMRWVGCWQTLRQQGLSGSAAAQALGLPRSTLYRWHKALRDEGPSGLRSKSRRPRRVRRPTWSVELSEAVLELRERFPRWGKDKLVVVLRRRGWQVSTSMTGRILTHLKAQRLRRPVGEHLTVAIALAHIQYWDGRAVGALEAWRRHNLPLTLWTNGEAW